MHQPSAWDRLKQQIGEWLLKQLAAIFKAAAQHPTTSQVVFCVAAVGALGVIAFLLFRLFWSEERTSLSVSPSVPATERNFSQWIAAARAASQSGDLNKAIQCLYWAAILSLENAGMLPRTTGLTPRELLKTVRARSEAVELRHLTSSLERFWYARVPATEDDFAACVRSVEALGCRVE